MFRISVLTLYPEMFPGPLGHALAGKAQGESYMLDAVNIRDFATNKHRSVDDTPSGGGPGMVMRADILASALDHVAPQDDPRPRLLMSPRGRPVTQRMIRDWVEGPGLVFVCGRFEGVDERVIASRNLQEVSLADIILNGGEVAALAMAEACIRLLPGVMGKEASGSEESFESGLLEYPHYTRPAVFDGHEIPSILASGDHKRIAEWRLRQAQALTARRRPDLWAKYRVETAKKT